MGDFDFGLPEEVALLREQVSRFAAERIAPRAARIDAENTFPRDLWPQFGSLGLFGITVAPEFGGAGLGYLAHVVAMEEISRGSAAVGLSYAAHSNLCVNQIATWGTPEQKRRFLPRLLDGVHVGALAMSEVCAGSDVLAMRTTATPDGDDYVLNGTKMWITNGPEADVLVVYARVAEAAPAAQGAGPTIMAAIVERNMPGFAAESKLDKLGMRGADTSGLVFRDCRIPAANVLPGNGKEILMWGLDTERVVLAGGALGIMRACHDVTIPYLHERKQFERPIGSFELMQGKLADMYSRMNASRAYVYAVAAACDRGARTRYDAAAAIMQASEAATWVAGQTIQALGGNGYANEYPAGRLWRDAKLYEIGAGTNEIRRMLIGRELFAATAGERR
jgi:isovaleryl-CoA dehydrogenase